MLPTMPKVPTTGRANIFRGKDLGKMRRGVLTAVGNLKFEAARKRLAMLAHRKTASDGDVMEALSRGWPATMTYLREHGIGTEP